ncbi:glutamine amidotransferase [Sphingomonas sp. LM7]|uniref:glutamine amidotransferase n=1 Tax=Sphingomonas sp. LM7 TaxID=1938607 RepID=UPI0009839E70|nr:glutamine amidotransferase [Sphingomonas sp. LM7]AQR73528.1 glutamine amidotransferase [Sphingomonas sp. LM7]
MLKTVAAIRHIAFEDLGFFEAPLLRAGYTVRYYDAGTDDLATIDPLATPLLVVLGGPMGVYEEDIHPFLTQELQLIATRIAAGKPILGICLGAQLIARAAGGRVYPGPAKEIGFAPISLTSEGAASPLGYVAPDQPVLHWHGDTFDLPEGATLLASTDAYANQAFAIGANVLALQFHLEAGAGIERWLTGHAGEIASAGLDPETLRQGAKLHAASLTQVADRVLTPWLAALEA